MSNNAFPAAATGLPSRRLILGSAVVAGVVALPASAQAHPDHELLKIGDDFEQTWRAERVGLAPRGLTDEQVAAFVDATSAVVDQIEVLPAKTLQGLRIKARAVAWCHDGDFCGFGDTTDERLAAQIIRDLLAL
jgi:hypothetical protein